MSRINPKTLMLAGAAVAAVGAAALMYRNKWRKEDDWLNRRSDSLETAEDRLLKELNRPRAISTAASEAIGRAPMRVGRLAQTPNASRAYLARGEPDPIDAPYGCDSFQRSCAPGDVGGCEYMRQSCATADNAVRMTMARPGECDQFRAQCMAGDYGSCDQYSRGCQYESM